MPGTHRAPPQAATVRALSDPARLRQCIRAETLAHRQSGISLLAEPDGIASCRIDQGEVRKLESRRHGTADQGVGLQRNGRLPPAGGHDALRQRTAAGGPKAMPDDGLAGPLAHQQLQRAALVPVPALVGEHAVPATHLAGFKQEPDRGRSGAVAARGGHALCGSQGLAVPATLGVLLETQFLDQPIGAMHAPVYAGAAAGNGAEVRRSRLLGCLGWLGSSRLPDFEASHWRHYSASRLTNTMRHGS